MNSNNSQVSVPANSALDSYPVVKAGFGGDFLLFVVFCAIIWGGWELVTRWRRSNENGSGSSYGTNTSADDYNRGNTGRTTYVSRRPGVTHVVDEDPTVIVHRRSPGVVVVPTYPSTVFVEEAPRDRVFVEENAVSGGTFVEEQPVSGGSVVEEEPVGYQDPNFDNRSNAVEEEPVGYENNNFSGGNNVVEEEPVGYQDSSFDIGNNAVEEEPVGYQDSSFDNNNSVVEETATYETPSYDPPADTTDYNQF